MGSNKTAVLSQPGSEQRNPLQPQPLSAVDLLDTRESGGVQPECQPGCLTLPPDTQSCCSYTVPLLPRLSPQEADTAAAPKAHSTRDFSIRLFVATVFRVVLLCEASGEPARQAWCWHVGEAAAPVGLEAAVTAKGPPQTVP